MNKGLITKLSFLAVCWAATAAAAPVGIGTLYLSNVGTGFVDPLDDLLEFRLRNWNGLPAGNVLNPVTFRNVSLTINWIDPGAPYTSTPSTFNSTTWYVGDQGHVNPLAVNDLAPNAQAYESTRFQRRWAFSEVTLHVEFDPIVWNLQGGGIYLPPASYDFVFTPGALPQNRSIQQQSLLPSFELELESVATPEPSTWALGGLGVIGVVIGRLRRRVSA